MKLEFLAHAAFLLTSTKGTKLLTDPYESGGFDGALSYQPITEPVDVITISHNHADHSYVAPCHQAATVINEPGAHKFADIKIFGTKTFHDAKKGQERGDNIVFTIKLNNIIVCHLGDLGHTLNTDALKSIGEIDVLLLPVGGLYTIDAVIATTVMQSLVPKICIPMHYKTDKLAFDFAPVSNFIQNKHHVKTIESSKVKLTQDTLPQTPEIWVLNHAK